MTLRHMLVGMTLAGITSLAHGQATRPVKTDAVDGAPSTRTDAGTTDSRNPSPADVDKHAQEEELKAWPKQVEAFTRALVNGDRNGVDLCLGTRAFFRKFDSHQFEDATRMLERAGKATIIGQHAYMHPPLVMAADMAADFKNATSIPDKIKARFVIDNENDMKRANATAVQWVVDQAEARQGSPIAIVILWVPRTTVTNVANANNAGATPVNEQGNPITTYELMFALVRGEEISRGQYRINYVVYGNPAAEPEK